MIEFDGLPESEEELELQRQTIEKWYARAYAITATDKPIENIKDEDI